jgi:hypothetical protein
MTSELSQTLEEIHIQSLEIDLIKYLAKRLQIDNREAMKLYYNSKLC